MIEVWMKILSLPVDRKIEVGDFGGGDGYFGKLSAGLSTNIRSTVIDFSVDKVDLGHGSVRYLSCDLNNDFPNEKFDLIIAWNLLEHLVDPENFLSQCNSSLNSDGLLVLQTPAPNNLFAKLTRKVYWGGLHAPRHFVIYSPGYLRKSLTKKGFEVISQRYVQDAHFATVSICHLLHLDKKVSSGISILNLNAYKIMLPLIAAFSIFWSAFLPSGQVQFVVRKCKN